MYSFKDFLYFLWLRKKALIVLTVLFAVLGSVGFYMKGFKYSTQVSFLLPATEQREAESLANNDQQEIENKAVASNIKLVETYKEMIKSDAVIEALQKELPQLSRETISQSLTVTNSINSQIFNVSVTADQPEKSKELAIRLSEKYPEIVEQSQLPRNVFLLSAQSFETMRSPRLTKVFAGIFLISLMLSTSSSFIYYYLKARAIIQTPELVPSLMDTEIIGVVDFYEC
ncbi:YveK family protein [Enterococcus raffinosus]|uniref:YveK family protein n=1 Tax=Enterococcus raffinosus TaxID=71452 RepID=UPI0022E4BC9B|nr:Wzz/FepE/Etk N-terminal domain-containing protein [Enterococcus raffinosus]